MRSLPVSLDESGFGKRFLPFLLFSFIRGDTIVSTHEVTKRPFSAHFCRENIPFPVSLQNAKFITLETALP